MYNIYIYIIIYAHTHRHIIIHILYIIYDMDNMSIGVTGLVLDLGILGAKKCG